MSRKELKEHSELWYLTFYILKFPATLAFGIFATLSALYLMQSLIDRGQLSIDEAKNLILVDFVRVKEDLAVKTKQRKPQKPPPPDQPPPEIKVNQNPISVDNAYSAIMQAPTINNDIQRLNAFSSDGEYLPIFKVKSVYPRQALQKGQFGWVLVEFTVDQLGRVVNPVIIDNCVDIYISGGSKECVDRPGRLFNGPALAAVKKYKYKPKIVDGVPIETQGVLNKVFFTLNEMREQ